MANPEPFCEAVPDTPGIAAMYVFGDDTGRARGVVSETIFLEFAAVSPELVARPTVNWKL